MTPAVFRKHFPALERRIHLASCSLGARSTDLDDALQRMAEDLSGDGWSSFEREVLQARQGFATLIGADVDQIALVPNASVGAYQAASTMEFGKRWKIVTSPVEFPSIAHVWLAQRPRGAEVVFDAEPDEHTRLVSVPLVAYRDGRRMPMPDPQGAQLFVDAYQAVGVMPVDVSELDCDFLVGGAMKYVSGLPGLAFLYVRSPDTERFPQLTGWFGRVNPFAFDPRTLDFPGTAARFETGTPAVPACYAANAALGLIGALDLAEVRMHVRQLTELAADRLTAQGELIHAPAERGAHIGLADPDPAAVARGLASRGVTVSPRGDLVRLSFHYYNNADDVAALCDALADLRSGR
ncbi:putative aminotransferase YcbU [Lentzea sp. NBRC 105346]|uniref:aminotransferase class V-fold PLP-dependent enzyme n=1 Tax=Lentzea sp. NBRC 105346 TaxID=3032205 RepID=UPI00255424FB|nr:aminotransferase class V-fold PLP-dependent enzyme [Lentzea sp. NBRC 105346]GLZ33852.1 putative aminotransferase YcbU [Lentzea sp. NBRC 105346]